MKFRNDYTTTLNNLEDLFTIIYVIIDDLYQKYAPVEVKKRKNVTESKISDPEIITISPVGEMPGIDFENAGYSVVKKNYLYLFPHLCSRSRFHRRRSCLHQTTDLFSAGLAEDCGKFSFVGMQIRSCTVLQKFPHRRGVIRKVSLQEGDLFRIQGSCIGNCRGVYCEI